jgi:hypothetical protein
MEFAALPQRRVARSEGKDEMKQARRWIAVLSVVAVGALVLAPAALAQSTGTGYGGESGVAGQTGQGGGSSGVTGQTTQGGGNAGGVAGETTSGSGNVASQSAEGNRVLAFTGLDIALLAGGGLVLLGSGLALSRLVARPQH